jgi:crossover junction endonuclease MUS81
MKRVRVAFDKPNRLFENWLEEWRNEAILRNSELEHHFTKALQSLRKYPLPLASGKECIILQHFGTKLCSMLDRKLQEHRKEQSQTQATDTRIVEVDDNEDRIAMPRKEPVRKNEFVEKTTLVTKQAENTKKIASKRLVNADEIVSKDTNKQICLEPNSFDIILLIDTQETCG